MRDILDELRELERQAGAVHDKFGDVNARAPSRAEGTDRTGAVRVVLDADGLPAEIMVAPGWRDVLAESEFERAVRDAFAHATGARMATWSQAIVTSSWPAPPDDGLTRIGDWPGRIGDRSDRIGGGTYGYDGYDYDGDDYGGSGGSGDGGRRDDRAMPDAGAWRRPFEDVLEDVLRGGDPVVVTAAPAPTGTGRDESGHLTLTVAPSGLVSCEAPARWLSYQSAEALTAALGQALGSARAELAAATRAVVPDDWPERHARLFGEVLARLTELRRLSESPLSDSPLSESPLSESPLSESPLTVPRLSES
jgi:hypothetical protein